MQEIIISLMEKYGYLGTFFLIFVENVFPPIPSEVILTFGGFMTRSTSMTVFGMVVAATLGSVFGAIVLYSIGRLLNRDRLVEIVTKYGSVLRVKLSHIDKAESWFTRYGNRTVFFCRMVPILRSLISIPAGMAEMRLHLFLFYTTLGTLIWNVILVSAGALLGENWERVVEFMDVYSSVAYTVILLSGIAFLFFVYLKRRRTRNEP